MSQSKGIRSFVSNGIEHRRQAWEAQAERLFARWVETGEAKLEAWSSQRWAMALQEAAAAFRASRNTIPLALRRRFEGLGASLQERTGLATSDQVEELAAQVRRLSRKVDRLSRRKRGDKSRSEDDEVRSVA